jgi:hypothetical protein
MGVPSSVNSIAESILKNGKIVKGALGKGSLRVKGYMTLCIIPDHRDFHQ